MASMNGITLRNIRRYTGVEGPAYQGNIYLGSKKIGFWSEDGDGGPDWFELDKNFSEEKLKKLITDTYPEKTVEWKTSDGRNFEIPYDVELFFSDLMILIDDEKQYKEFQKSNCGIMVIVTDGYHLNAFGLRQPYYSDYYDLTDEQIKEKLSDKIKAAEEKFFADKETEVKIYRSLDDFNIGEPFTLDQILTAPTTYVVGFS